MAQKVRRRESTRLYTMLVRIQDQLKGNLQDRQAENPHVHHSLAPARQIDFPKKSKGRCRCTTSIEFGKKISKKREAYAQLLLNLPPIAHIIYIDERGFNVFQRRRQGRAEVGADMSNAI